MSMHYCQQGAVWPTTYVVTCKKCTRSIPAGAQEFPRGNLVVQCSLCGELRRYRPLYVAFRGVRIDSRFGGKAVRPLGQRRLSLSLRSATAPLFARRGESKASEVYVWSVARLQAISFDGRSGLLLCIRLLGEAMDLLRAMMESAPALS
jgi:hypothetical protein